ncbi:Crp/Fnr family transcriptional regulator [Rhodobacterales bacterium]|nr:Crp/Fnr family transcriptional regulator [Rhodobacterales bacterium]
MSETSVSCLITKLSHYLTLTDDSREKLAILEEEEISFSRGSEIYTIDDANEHLYVVKSGWLYTYLDLPDGRRQIVKIHHPGDIIGFADIAFRQATTNLAAAEDVVLCPFPKRGLRMIFGEAPQITALMFSIAVRDQVVLLDTLRALGRMSSRERLVYFLLDLVSRLRITNRSMTDTFRLPLTQTEIGDTIGLTNVYVSRAFTALEKDGLIARTAKGVRIVSEAELKAMVDFADRYEQMDTTWFPE